MSAPDEASPQPTACTDCRRRGWLLAALGPNLDYRCGDPERWLAVMALDDEQLIEAAAGRRKRDLRARYRRSEPPARFVRPASAVDVQAVCRCDSRFPKALADPWAPRSLNVAGGLERLVGLLAAPAVAIVGGARATDYGIEAARALARGLTVSGVTVIAAVGDGIAGAVHAGVLEVAGGAVGVLAGGLDVAAGSRAGRLVQGIARRGCALTELPPSSPARPSAHAGAVRTVAGLAQLTVVVEADDTPRELLGARLAEAIDRRVAAVPGRITSPASRGTHALLARGAPLVRGPADMFELLAGCEASAPAMQEGGMRLEPRLAATLELVAAGADTPDKLTRAQLEPGDALLALCELELLGLLARGDGGRYLPREL